MYSFLDHANNYLPEIKMGNPISANPCSLTAVKSVMQSFKGDLNIPHSRQWSIVGWHGLPYLLSHRVIHDIPEFYISYPALTWSFWNKHVKRWYFRSRDCVCVEGGGLEVLMVGVQPFRRNILDPCIFLLFIPSMFHVV